MASSSSDSHVRSPSIRSSTSHEQRSSGSKAGRLFDKLKVGSSSKRKQQPNANSETSAAPSPFSLAQRLRVLLDAHPINSPAPTFQPLPTPETSPTSPTPSSVQQLDPFPTSPILSPVSTLSSPIAYFSAPSSPADAEILALLSSPISMAGSLPAQDSVPVPGSLHTSPIAGPSMFPDPAHTPPPLSPARYQTVFNILNRIGSPKARARRLSRITDDGSRARDTRESQNGYPASPLAWPVSPAMSSISSVLASGSVTAAYGSDGMRDIEEESSDDDADDTNIMMYSPLMPTPTSLVSIADTEVSVVPVQEEESDEEGTEPVQDNPAPVPDAQPQQTETRSGWSWSNLLSFSSWFSSPNQGSGSTSNTTEPQAATTQSRRATVQSRPTSAQVRLRRRRVWVPSRTQLSLETMWWGYRIYIPPRVLDALDSTSVETSRRAALLTAALTWFFTNFPVNVLPIPVRPVIIILQGLVPYLGYLGGILSWSWGSIKSYDEGYGIILTATWVMPIALIPSTWVPPPSEWPGSPLSTTSATFSSNTSPSTPTLSTLSPTQATTLSPTMSQSTSTPISFSPTISESTVTPFPMLSTSLPASPRSPAITLPLQLEQIQELRERAQQRQAFPMYSPAPLPVPPRSTAPSVPVEQHYFPQPPGQTQRQEQQSYPMYSPYSYTTMLSPLPQLSSSFPSPAQNGSPYAHAYGYPFPTTSQTTPIMAMSMISPIPSNGGIVYSPALSPLPAIPTSYSPSFTPPTPTPCTTLPETSTPLSSIRKRANRRENGTSSGGGSLNAPRIATVPLPDDV
ncbi:hypothetical protein APHAL10511_006909 [Amanita phalloides]|nr:hypothetical protein APHAL10511_006909 [Amanita phalloides]